MAIRRILPRRTKPTEQQQLRMMERWFDTERGRRLLSRETELVGEALTQSFGYHLLQLSVDSRTVLFKHSRVQRKYRCHPFNASADALCRCEQLPFDSESIDVVILHHVQEFAGDPHPLLREVQRVLVPNGQVLILGFNPWSMLGAVSRLSCFLPESPWQNRMITCHRVKDWLGLLGFEILGVDYGMRVPRSVPKRAGTLVNSLWRRWPFGGFYLISAIKQVATFTPARPKWKPSGKGFEVLSPVKIRPVGYQPYPARTAQNPCLTKSLPAGRKVA